VTNRCCASFAIGARVLSVIAITVAPASTALPVGAVAGPAALMAIFDHTKGKPAVAQGGTFSANPLTMAAGLATLKALDRAAAERLNGLGDRLRTRVNDSLRQLTLPAQLTGWGSLFRLHLTARTIRDYRSCWTPPARKRALASVHGAMLSGGVLLTPNCSGALSTPMMEADIDEVAQHLVDAVQDVHRRDPWTD
jgi:glutamate-1-semialdehyde 2,1-aminomutase